MTFEKAQIEQQYGEHIRAVLRENNTIDVTHEIIEEAMCRVHLDHEKLREEDEDGWLYRVGEVWSAWHSK